MKYNIPAFLYRLFMTLHSTIVLPGLRHSIQKYRRPMWFSEFCIIRVLTGMVIFSFSIRCDVSFDFWVRACLTPAWGSPIVLSSVTGDLPR
ncbi:hypothetical protein F5Y11DRAFT_282207 [Daldinia sp. FL1419]|nr:hypothetical protein F5Y11DRAFT_282207 [Daldinia sp. FL1419]